MKDDRVYLAHIIECIRNIQEDTRGEREFFLANRTARDAVLRNLHTLTESTQHLSPQVKDSHPEVEWLKIAAFRNVVVHNYLGIDLSRIWDVIVQDLPILDRQMKLILSQFPAPPARDG